ncbi:substrate-binding domain-containing protein [Kitasatospora sp. NPDC048407]|uniref:substrate-binding domain-containing protein n=1 Tax=Kitasatospora sp. NPDC048407 TaxID=3364051 RepID=UPI0037120193
MDEEIVGLSSMATRPILAELSEWIGRAHDMPVRFESAGGVEVARRVREGAAGDVLVLAEDALAALAAEGLVLAATARPLWVSQVVAAVPEGSPAPALDSQEALRAALLTARRIAYSTGPSGTAVLELINRQGLAEALRDRLVQAPPGVPAGTLLASGEADLAFQQHSELMDLPGVRVVGPLPGDAGISTTFAGAVLTASARPGPAGEVLDLLAAEEAAEAARARGMRPAARPSARDRPTSG